MSLFTSMDHSLRVFLDRWYPRFFSWFCWRTPEAFALSQLWIDRRLFIDVYAQSGRGNVRLSTDQSATINILVQDRIFIRQPNTLGANTRSVRFSQRRKWRLEHFYQANSSVGTFTTTKSTWRWRLSGRRPCGRRALLMRTRWGFAKTFNYAILDTRWSALEQHASIKCLFRISVLLSI